MPANEAKDAIRFLQQEISVQIDQSEKGRVARSEANLDGASHLGAIIVSSDEPDSGNGLAFRAVVELYDDAGHQYEAEIQGAVQRAGNGGWTLARLSVVDAGPLPKGG
ncbi:hypothetical protein ACFQUU_01955 [Herbaspirillum sp. GCM10030257]|uniref:hypothetical protein n=1 Tax=Herbaspirillum sp. GCM10030257 TaxID=3273393 RepID=UPI0036215654